jgi:adenosylcobinamide kinase / adenosylcobinamide-phosphate guanylyltransferase
VKLWAQDDAVLLGAADRPWPVAGCRCRACLAAGDTSDAGTTGAMGQTTRLNWGPVTLVAEGFRSDADGPTSTLVPGTTAEVAGVRLLALPTAGLGLALVVGRGGRSLLWAPLTGPLPAETVQALRDGELDAAVLDVRGADGTPDLLALAHEVARLRAVAALAPGAAVAAVGWSHDCDPSRSAALLTAWGVSRAAAEVPARSTPPWRTLVLGAASSGKSQYAEALLAAEPAVSYVATAPSPSPADPEWATKVARHRRRRPLWWHTTETTDLPGLLATPGPPVLLDSLGTWTTATLERCGAWDDGAHWQQQWEQEVAAVVQAWRDSARRVVAVAEETGWGVVPPTPAGRVFRDALGTLNRRLAAETERVVLMVAGQPLELASGAVGGGVV